MKNKPFFYLQYDKLKWKNQAKTKINYSVFNYIIKNILPKKGKEISLFDIGFGTGNFFEVLGKKLIKNYEHILLSGCEPAEENYNYFLEHLPVKNKAINLLTYNSSFEALNLSEKFDFIIAVYVFPHFSSDDLPEIVNKIYSLLKDNGKFVLIVAEENYLKQKLTSRKDLYIEKNEIVFDNKKYNEYLHYTEIPLIGTLIDYNREEKFYLDLFSKSKFNLVSKTTLDDMGFICNVFVFGK